MIKNLLLVRHAAAVKGDSDLKDFDRPLSDAGLHDALVMAKKVADKNLPVDKIVSSPSLRTKMTAEFFAEQSSKSIDDIVYDENIYEASVRILINVINEFSDQWNTVTLVGHNPGFSYLAELLTKEEIGSMPTCAVMMIQFEIDSWKKIGDKIGKTLFYEIPS